MIRSQQDLLEYLQQRHGMIRPTDRFPHWPLLTCAVKLGTVRRIPFSVWAFFRLSDLGRSMLIEGETGNLFKWAGMSW